MWALLKYFPHFLTKYFQVSLGRDMVVSGVITQGRYAGGQGEEFAEQVTVQVSHFRGWKPLLCHKDTGPSYIPVRTDHLSASGLGLKSAAPVI